MPLNWPKSSRLLSPSRRAINLQFLARFRRDLAGGVLIYTAILMTGLVGFGGVAIDVGYWYATKRSAQSAADAAALTGALEVNRGTNETTMKSMAKADAAENGYTEGADTKIEINNPPSTGPYVGDADAVEAIIQQNVPGFLGQVLHVDWITVAARAVASGSRGDGCLYVLDPTEDGALSVGGKAIVEMDCGAMVSSDSPTSVDQVGKNSCLTATTIKTHGQASGDCLNPTPTNTPPVDDPFQHLSAPSLGGCTHVALVTVTSPTALDPGNYCGGLKINDDVTFNSGDYQVGGIGLHIQGNSHVTGTDVSFYLPPTTTGLVGAGNSPTVSLNIAGTTEVELSAPTTGPYQNMLFYQDPYSDPNLEIQLLGGTDMNLEGIIYAPRNHMRYAGGSDQNDGWLVTLVDTIQFSGNSYVQGPAPTVDLPFALVKPTLVE